MPAIDFKYIAGLKGRLRKGWTYERRIPPEAVESVADHSYGTAMLCLAHCPPELDRDKAVRMALAHDFAEAIAPDYTPHDDIPPEEKARQEKAVFEEADRPELLELWLEYERRESALARFVYAMDKLECLLQAERYWRAYGIELGSWIDSLKPKIPPELLKAAFPAGRIGPFEL